MSLPQIADANTRRSIEAFPGHEMTWQRSSKVEMASLYGECATGLRVDG